MAFPPGDRRQVDDDVDDQDEQAGHEGPDSKAYLAQIGWALAHQEDRPALTRPLFMLPTRWPGVQPRGERRGAGPEPQFPCPAQVRRLIDIAAEAGQAG